MSSLENNEIDEIKNLYNTFKDELKADIKNNTITKGKDCYLIKKPWDSELYKNIINNYNRNSYTRKSSRFHHDTTNNNTLNLPTNSPEFINDIKTIISCIKDGEELKLQNPKLIDFIDKKKRLIVKKNLLNYLAGNNKILLELPDNKYKTEDEVLLIDNAFSVPEGISKIMRNVYLIKYKVKSFRMRYKKDELYELLLSPTKVEKLNLDPYKNDNSNIQVEIEDIYKENNSSPTNISGNQAKQFDYRRRIRGEKTEDTNSIKEKNSENTREEKLANPSYNNNKYGIRKQMSTINSTNKNEKENNFISKKYNYYSNQIDNSTISTENSRNNNNNYNNKYNYINKYNNKYIGDSTFNNSSFNYNNNKFNENKFDNLGKEQSKYNKNNSYENFQNYKETTISSYNKLPKIENKYDNQNYYNSNSNLRLNYENNDFNEPIYMYEECNEQNYQIVSDNNEQNNQIVGNNNEENNYNENNPDEEKNKINENSDKKATLKSFLLKENNEFTEKIFEKYKQNNCISNYTILRNKIDLNIYVDMEKLKNVKLLYFFDCFKDINHLSLDIPFITDKGRLLINEFNPTLSSMRLILKSSKKIARKIKKNKKENFIIKTIKPNLLKIEYAEIKAPFERDILYKKIVEIEEILGDNKIAFKHVLQEKSYFCVLWTNKNTHIINTSFLAYYSFKLKLIGVLMIKLNSESWLSSFSYNSNNYKDYQIEYDKDDKNIIEYFNNLSLEKGDYYQNFYTADYRSYILSQKIKQKK